MKQKLMNELVEYLANQIQTSSVTGMATDAINTSDQISTIVTNACSGQIFTGVKLIASSLVVLFFLIYLVEDVMKNKNDSDNIIKTIAFCLLMTTIISKLDVIVPALSQLCTKIIDIVNTGASTIFTTNKTPKTLGEEEIKGIFKDLNLIQIVFNYLLYKIIGGLAISIVTIVVKVAIFTTEIEIAVRTALFPLGICQLPIDGWHGAGGRYIRSWVGCFLNLAVCIVAVNAYDMLMAFAVYSNPAGMLVAILAAGFACAGLCMKASSISKELVGA